jgi:hypothetical protein
MENHFILSFRQMKNWSCTSIAFFILAVICPIHHAFAADTLCDGKFPEIISTKLSKIESVIDKNHYKDMLAAHMKGEYEAAAHAYDDEILAPRFASLSNEMANKCHGPLLRKIFAAMDESLSEVDIEAISGVLSKKNTDASDMEYLESFPENVDLAEKYKAYLGSLDVAVADFMSKTSAMYKERACAVVRGKQGPKSVIKYDWSAYMNQRQRAVYIYEDCKIE